MSVQLSIRSNEDNVLQDIENTQKLCSALMKTPHYAKMGEVGIFAVVQKARSIGMNPLDALNGAMYFVQGKVEMSGQAMLAVIRAHGHSVSMDPKSTDQKVIMYGKRADNGDGWRVEFSVEDAKRQGIFRNQWEKMPKVMCMWRCVSQLGRFLFSDILKGVYVQGEISESIPGLADKIHEHLKPSYLNDDEEDDEKIEDDKKAKKVTMEQAIELGEIISECSEEYQLKVTEYLKSQNLQKLTDLPYEAFMSLKEKAAFRREEYQASLKKEDKADFTEYRQATLFQEEDAS